MTTDCTAQKYLFQAPGRREMVAAFDGGSITSDGGAVLLQQVDHKRRILQSFVECFQDARDPRQIEHSLEELLRQRIFGLALGYEDLNDHDELRLDPLLATVVGKSDPLGRKRRQSRDLGKALAGKSTLNRLEWGCTEEVEGDRYRRIAVDGEAVDRFFVSRFLETSKKPPKQIILDVDATDDPLYGQQEGRFFHGYYRSYCYLPLYIFAGSHLLCARLRRSNIDASAGTVDELERIVQQIRESWPRVKILVRGDAGFAREELMSWCEANAVDYVLGLARNPRLEKLLAPTMDRAFEVSSHTGKSARRYGEWQYSTLETWSRDRRVIGKAEITQCGENPRFIVTSLPAHRNAGKRVYEEIYCARGDMENRIKEQQLDLFATRTSGRLMRVNQLRLWFSSVAYVLLNELRRLGLEGTRWAGARPFTLRLKLLKIGARIRVSARKVWVSLSTGYPHERLFAHVYAQLRRAGPCPA